MILHSQACLSWLQYLSKSSAKALVGDVEDKHIQVIGLYDIYPDAFEYCAEVPLKGAPGMDLSCRYPIASFLQRNPLNANMLKSCGDFFHSFAKEQHKLLPAITPLSYCYLETDTASGVSDKTALFLNIAGKLVPDLLPKVMEWQQHADSLPKVNAYLQQVKPEAGLWYIGFMNSREQTPLRLVLHSLNRKPMELLTVAERLGKVQAAEQMKQFAALLEKTGFCSFFLDVDVMPDGSLGDTVGLEILMPKPIPQQQKEILLLPAFKELFSLLQTTGAADERLELLTDCIFSMKAPDNFQKPYILLSKLSHIKLSWQQGKLLPAKAYLYMKTANFVGK